VLCTNLNTTLANSVLLLCSNVFIVVVKQRVLVFSVRVVQLFQCLALGLDTKHHCAHRGQEHEHTRCDVAPEQIHARTCADEMSEQHGACCTSEARAQCVEEGNGECAD
jgi:hypothetical protein